MNITIQSASNENRFSELDNGAIKSLTSDVIIAIDEIGKNPQQMFDTMDSLFTLGEDVNISVESVESAQSGKRLIMVADFLTEIYIQERLKSDDLKTIMLTRDRIQRLLKDSALQTTSLTSKIFSRNRELIEQEGYDSDLHLIRGYLSLNLDTLLSEFRY